MRGSLVVVDRHAVAVGSIPAGAGEPPKGVGQSFHVRVDPRGCGGAVNTMQQEVLESGRSPRVRGSHFSRHVARRRAGSIPAGAGEPYRLGKCACTRRVDPRGCGGAAYDIDGHDFLEGRSPRVRGSQRQECFDRPYLGSIPAGAGEPTVLRVAIGDRRVDPRGCGGALVALLTDS